MLKTFVFLIVLAAATLLASREAQSYRLIQYAPDFAGVWWPYEAYPPAPGDELTAEFCVNNQPVGGIGQPMSYDEALSLIDAVNQWQYIEDLAGGTSKLRVSLATQCNFEPPNSVATCFGNPTDGNNSIRVANLDVWFPPGPDQLVTGISCMDVFDSGEIDNCDIVLSGTGTMESHGESFAAVMVHELGHCVGLDHPCPLSECESGCDALPALMCPSPGHAEHRDTIQVDDIAGLWHIYQDADADSCTGLEETNLLGPNPPQRGGDRDPNVRDFADVPTPLLVPSNTSGKRSGAITLADVQATLGVVGAVNDGGPLALNGFDYDQDLNANGVEDGIEYDFRPSLDPSKPWRSGPPSGSITLQDVSVILGRVGDVCVSGP